jgi:acyl carrier protein
MSDVRARLVKCFAAVFSELGEEEVALASPATVGTWDSLASITLVSVIEEEFATHIDPDDLEHLVSFELVLDYLQNEKQLS